MKRILVTGGTGMLGRVLVPKLQQAGYTVRVQSRQPRPANDARRDVSVKRLPEWAQADVLTGEGIQDSVRDVDVIIHGATSPSQNIHAVEVEGTRNVLHAAREANVSHFIYVSIVGIDRTPYEYYTAKLDAERVVETFQQEFQRETSQRNVSTGWTILRGTQFYELIDFRMKRLARKLVAVIDPHMKFQPVDVREFSDRLVELAGQPAQGMAPDFAGPQVLELDEIFRQWREAKGVRRIVLKAKAPGKFEEACRQGLNTNPQQSVGKITWRDWLAETYGRNGNGRGD